MNFIRGNNNESTSEAATAYGAIILYGMATGNDALTEKGMYLHASTGAAIGSTGITSMVTTMLALMPITLCPAMPI